MSDRGDFRDAVEDVIWRFSNLPTDERADILRQFADELDADDSPFDDVQEHVRRRLADSGMEPPGDDDE